MKGEMKGCDQQLKSINSGKGEKGGGGTMRGAAGAMYKFGGGKSSYAKSMSHRKKGK